MQIPSWLKKVQENLARSNIKPIFADEAVVMGTIKARQTEKGEVKKEGQIRIAFIDMTTLQPIAKIVVTLSTAKGLIRALQNQVKKLEEDLASEKIPKWAKKEKEPLLTYIG